MSPTNDTKVLIGGNVYTLSGNESEEYIQRVALYINNKLDEITKSDNAKQLNNRLISVLLDINIADDYFKAKETINELKEQLASKDNDMEEVNEQLLEVLNEQDNLKAVIEDLKKEVESYKAELTEYIEIFDQENTN